MRAIIATTNKGKLSEYRYVLEKEGIEVVSVGEIGLREFPEEEGKTYLSNANAKVMHIVKNIKVDKGSIVVADDTGLEVDRLIGELGLYSARYLGYGIPYEMKNRNILKELEFIKKKGRTARYVCGMSAWVRGCILNFEGVLDGYIASKEVIGRGEAFDPIFELKNGQILDVVDMETKMQVSHRAKALRQLIKTLSIIR